MSTTRADHPLYQKAISLYLACDNRRFALLSDSPLLSAEERTLLRVRRLFSAGAYREALASLRYSGSASGFLAAEKHFLTATAHARLGDWEMSLLENGRALELYRAVPDRRGEFLTLYNAAVDAQSLGLKRLAHHHLDAALVRAEGLDEELLVVRARACNLSQERAYAAAKEEIERALERSAEEGTHLDTVTLRVVASDIFFRAGDAAGARALLEEVKGGRLTKNRARLFFNLGLLRFMENGQLEDMPRALEESREYTLKWGVLVALECGDLVRAEELWMDLVALFPQTFAAGFACLNLFDQEGLFCQAVQAIRGKTSLPADVALPAGSKLEALHVALTASRIPLRKEELIEKVWKRPYDPALDQRFYKLVQRMKDMRLPLVNERRAYYYRRA